MQAASSNPDSTAARSGEKPALVPPFPPPLRTANTLGFLAAVRRNVLESFHEVAYDELMVRGRVLGRPVTLVSDPAGVRRVLVENAANYVKPPVMVRIVRPFTGDGLLTTEGDAWRAQRRHVAHAFTPASIGALLPRFEEAAEGMLSGLAGVEEADLVAVFDRATLDAVTGALFSGAGVDRRERLNALIRGYVSADGGPGRPRMLDFIARRPDDFAVFDGARRAWQARWFAEVDAVIAARRAEGERAEPDLLDQMLAARDASGRPVDPDEIRSQVATFIAAGFETTARLLFWTAYLLALDRAEQARVREELDASPQAPASLDDLSRWPRLRCVLQETLRLYPTAPVIARLAVADDRIAGEQIRAGEQVTVSPWVIHRHRRLWEEPTAFRPERFEGKPQAHLTGGAYLPFSLGPRICIGATFAMAEATVLLVALLSRYEVSLRSDRPVMPIANASIRPDHATRFRLTPVRPSLRTAA
jgi:cytochrome P450